MRELQDRYQISDFEAVDNILDMSCYSSLLPALADDDRDRRIFYEIKANLSRAHVQSLVRAGSPGSSRESRACTPTCSR